MRSLSVLAPAPPATARCWLLAAAALRPHLDPAVVCEASPVEADLADLMLSTQLSNLLAHSFSSSLQ